MLDFVKNLGVGTAKQNWKPHEVRAAKQHLFGKGPKASHIVWPEPAAEGVSKSRETVLVGKLWEDKDFKTMRMTCIVGTCGNRSRCCR